MSSAVQCVWREGCADTRRCKEAGHCTRGVPKEMEASRTSKTVLEQLEAWIASEKGRKFVCTRQYPYPGYACDHYPDCEGCLIVAAALELKRPAIETSGGIETVAHPTTGKRVMIEIDCPDDAIDARWVVGHWCGADWWTGIPGHWIKIEDGWRVLRWRDLPQINAVEPTVPNAHCNGCGQDYVATKGHVCPAVKAPCERCEGSGRLTIYDTAMYPGQACSPIGDEPCPACQPENGKGDI